MSNVEYLMYLKFDEFLEYVVRLADQANFSDGATSGFQGWKVEQPSDDE